MIWLHKKYALNSSKVVVTASLFWINFHLVFCVSIDLCFLFDCFLVYKKSSEAHISFLTTIPWYCSLCHYFSCSWQFPHSPTLTIVFVARFPCCCNWCEKQCKYPNKRCQWVHTAKWIFQASKLLWCTSSICWKIWWSDKEVHFLYMPVIVYIDGVIIWFNEFSLWPATPAYCWIC